MILGDKQGLKIERLWRKTKKKAKKRLLRIGEDRFIKVKIKVKDETTLTTDHLLITG